MSAIEQIQAKLAKYPGVRSELADSGEGRRLTVLPQNADGFAVSLVERPGHWTVAYDGWHEEFETADEALACFAFGLSAECRLRVEYRGTAAVKWTVEALAAGQWAEDSTTGLFHPFVWRRRRVRYLQNHLVPSEPPGGTAPPDHRGV